MIFVDKSVLTSETAVVSVAYSKVEEIAIEKGKTFSLANTVGVKTKAGDHELKFAKDMDVLGFYKALTKHVCQ